MAKVQVGKIEEVGNNQMKSYNIAGKEIVIANIDGEYMAFDGTCTHQQCSLAGGFLDGYTLTCYCHGAQFDVKKGDVLAPPATIPLKIYKVTLEGDTFTLEM